MQGGVEWSEGEEMWFIVSEGCTGGVKGYEGSGLG